MGLGAAMTFPATLSLISNVFTERRERARAIGLWGAIGGVAIAMGPIVGGWLLEHFSWAAIFIAMAPVAAAAAAGVALVVPASKDPDAGAADIAGLVLSSAAMALLVFTIIEAPAYGWAAPRSLAGFAASAVGAGSVAGTALAVRAGTKLIVTTGLVAMAAFYVWVAASTSATLGYGVIAAQMVLYGLGLGLTSAPATESIMGAISRRKAGVGSAVNDSTRLIGGTLGVAVIGSVYASVYGSRLTATMPASVPGPVASIAHQSIGAAYVAAGQIAALGHPVLGLVLQHASANAFLRGLAIGALVAGGVAAVGALLAVLFLPAQPAQPAVPAADEAEPADGRRVAETPAHPAAAAR